MIIKLFEIIVRKTNIYNVLSRYIILLYTILFQNIMFEALTRIIHALVKIKIQFKGLLLLLGDTITYVYYDKQKDRLRKGTCTLLYVPENIKSLIEIYYFIKTSK
uniref:Uncharacterized protein n=1 Tax=Schizaphis graminum TaxID=13262 RepID=A0A2S2NNZ0_SCHGA